MELVRHPYIHDVPISRRSGHIDGDEMERFAATFRTMEALVDTGVVTSDRHYDDFAGYEEPRPMNYRAPLLMRGAVASLRGERGERE